MFRSTDNSCLFDFYSETYLSKKELKVMFSRYTGGVAAYPPPCRKPVTSAHLISFHINKRRMKLS